MAGNRSRDPSGCSHLTVARKRVPSLPVRPVGRAVAAPRTAKGNPIMVRYADDLVVGFQYERQARRFLSGPARTVQAVCTIAAPNEDASHPFWPFCGRGSQARGFETREYLPQREHRISQRIKAGLRGN